MKELEEVQSVDKKGNVKVKLRQVKQKRPGTETPTPSRSQKPLKWKSPSPMKSPVASGSDHPITKLKVSKVRYVGHDVVLRHKTLI